VKRNSSFKSEMLGFYFSINGLRIPEELKNQAQEHAG
jgi:hypothetical protein